MKDADIVFDTLGNDYSLEAFKVIRQGGKVVSVAGPLDEETAKMFGMADYKLPEELSKLISAKDATYKYIFMHPNGAHLGQIKSLVEDEKIKAIIDKAYSFYESIEAFTHLASGRAKGSSQNLSMLQPPVSTYGENKTNVTRLSVLPINPTPWNNDVFNAFQSSPLFSDSLLLMSNPRHIFIRC